MTWDSPATTTSTSDNWGSGNDTAANDTWTQVADTGYGASSASGYGNGNGNGDSYGDAGEQQSSSACRKCNEEGHFSRECPNRQPDDDKCHRCGESGHFSRECPNKPPADDKCRRCGETGHMVRECSLPAPVNEEDLPSVFGSAEEAWANLISKDREELEEFRAAFMEYVKTAPGETFVDIEQKLRDAKAKTHIIALERELESYNSYFNLQREPGQKYLANFSRKVPGTGRRPTPGAPRSVEENAQRLPHAGFLRKVPGEYCYNCRQPGHVSRDCPEPKVEIERKDGVTCYNCENEGHRTRDCPEPRKQKGGPMTCNLCQEEGHKRSDCPQNTGGGGGACFNCGGEGHQSRECPEPRKPRGGSCYNCSAEDHQSRECPEPRKPRERTNDSYGQSTSSHGEQASYGASNEAPASGNNDWDQPQASGDGSWGSALAPQASGDGAWGSAPAVSSSGSGW